MKTGDLAERLNTHPNTIRAWAREYSDFLSDKANAARRSYSEDDALVIATVANLRESGLLHEQIEQSLQNGTRVNSVPELPTPEEQAARESISLVPSSEYQRIIDRVQTLQGELEQARQERDNAIEQWQLGTTELNKRIAELEHNLGIAQGELKRLESERLPVTFWLMILAAVIVIVAIAVYLLATSGAG